MFFIFGVKIKRITINISKKFKLVEFEDIFVCKENRLKRLKKYIEVFEENAINLLCYRANIL